MIRPDSQNDRLLAVLSDNEWHTSRELHERAGYMRTNSRISELRSHGFEIQGESVPGRTGTDGYRYKLLHDPTQRAEATTAPEGAKGWVDQAGSAQVLAGGHGLDVAPDASPEGARAEVRHASTTAGVGRALPPTPDKLSAPVPSSGHREAAHREETFDLSRRRDPGYEPGSTGALTVPPCPHSADARAVPPSHTPCARAGQLDLFTGAVA